jgi:CRP-like cAMP-binding protein
MSAIAPILPLTIVVRTGGQPARQGEPSTGVFVVETGVLLSSHVTDDGRRLGELLGPGDAVGGPEALPSPVTVKALRPCRLRCALPGERAALLDARTARVFALAHELAWLGVARRLERRLRETALRFGGPVPGGGLGLGVRLTQDDLAEVTGCTRESVNRAIRSMVAGGTLRIAGRGRYELPGLATALGTPAGGRR